MVAGGSRKLLVRSAGESGCAEHDEPHRCHLSPHSHPVTSLLPSQGSGAPLAKVTQGCGVAWVQTREFLSRTKPTVWLEGTLPTLLQDSSASVGRTPGLGR